MSRAADRPASEDASGGRHAVEFRQITKAFGAATVLDDISFEAKQGEFLTLLGPSGCGKTTSLRILAGFEQADAGDVKLHGRSVNRLPPWNRDIGVVFQSYALFPYLTARDNVAFGLKMRKVDKVEIARRVGAALEQVGLGAFADRYPRHLSGGQRQRVALARALVIEPQLLLLDEPLSNLDAKLRNEMRYELKRIQRETGVTTIFVTHDQEEAFSLSDKIILMHGGKIKQASTPSGLWEKPASAFVADFIGVENLIPAKVVKSDGRMGLSLSPNLVVHPAEVPFVANADVICGLRASDVQMTSSHPAGAGNTGFPARILDAEYRGKERLYRLETTIADRPILAMAPSSQEFAQEVTVTFPQDRIMVLSDDR